MKALLLIAAFVLPTNAMAQDYSPNFQFRSLVFDPQKSLQSGYPLNPELPAVTKPHNTMDRLSDLNIETNPEPVLVQPVQPVQPVQVQPIPAAPPKPKPPTQNIEGSLHVDPDSFGGGN